MTFIREKKALMEGIDIQHILRAKLSRCRLHQPLNTLVASSLTAVRGLDSGIKTRGGQTRAWDQKWTGKLFNVAQLRTF